MIKKAFISSVISDFSFYELTSCKDMHFDSLTFKDEISLSMPREKLVGLAWVNETYGVISSGEKTNCSQISNHKNAP